MSEAELSALIDAVLRRHVDGYESLLRCDRLSGGASQETYRIDARVAGTEVSYALRRAAGGEQGPHDDETYPGLAVEAQLMRCAKEVGVPAPRVDHVLEPDDGLGAGFFMSWLDGETLGAKIVRGAEFADVRPKLAYECGGILARIHAIDLDKTNLRQALAVLDPKTFIEQVWARYRALDTPQAMIDYTARWLLGHLPPETEPRLVHNDFRNGNLMIDRNGVVAVLDWELAHIGDPVRDLGWICTNSWRFGNSEQVVGGFGDVDDLLAGYADAGGVAVTRAHLDFWIVFGSFWWAAHCLLMHDHYRNGLDRAVERPGIARRTSECQIDCVNLIIPGPINLLEANPDVDTDMPRIVELTESVRDFLREDVKNALPGRSGFMARVAANSLDIVLRDAALGPNMRAQELGRLQQLFGLEEDAQDALGALRWKLVTGLRDGSIPLDYPGLADHLRGTVANQLAVDQPTYSGLHDAVN